jgi:hypothetical protein
MPDSSNHDRVDPISYLQDESSQAQETSDGGHLHASSGASEVGRGSGVCTSTRRRDGDTSTNMASRVGSDSGARGLSNGDGDDNAGGLRGGGGESIPGA